MWFSNQIKKDLLALSSSYFPKRKARFDSGGNLIFPNFLNWQGKVFFFNFRLQKRRQMLLKLCLLLFHRFLIKSYPVWKVLFNYDY